MDKRQRAMLWQMGVRVWQPLPEAVLLAQAMPTAPARPTNNLDAAIDLVAASARDNLPKASFDTQRLPVAAAPTAAHANNTAPAWRVGVAQTLYADTAVQTASRWLVLLETPASALLDGFNPLDGDAGKLLDNMLHAARLHTAGRVQLAPLVRSGTGDGVLPNVLDELLFSAKAYVVLLMGRLAAQALLQSGEPLAKLRGQAHAVQGRKIVITLDPAYLLRNPLGKAKAWDDLCLAISVANAS